MMSKSLFVFIKTSLALTVFSLIVAQKREKSKSPSQGNEKEVKNWKYG